MSAIANFISLSKIDEKIQEIESSKGNLPARLKKLESNFNSLNENKSSLSEKIVELDKSKTSLLNQKEDCSVKLEKYKDQLYLVKNNKEYDALNSEMDVIKSELAEITKELSSVDIDKVNFEEQDKTIGLEIEECSERLEKVQSQLEESTVNTKSEYDNLVKERGQLMPNLDSDSLQIYDRMLKAKGHGMVPVSTSNACGNCFTVLPTQLITEIKPNLEIKHCPSCNILLYYDQE